MIEVKVHGAKEVAATFRRLASTRVRRRIVQPGLREGAGLVVQKAQQPGFGFTDETGRLRRSLRIEQARDARGRFASGIAIVTRVRYANIVEWARRPRGRRAGPPYWLHRALELQRPKVFRAIARSVAERLRWEVDKL